MKRVSFMRIPAGVALAAAAVEHALSMNDGPSRNLGVAEITLPECGNDLASPERGERGFGSSPEAHFVCTSLWPVSSFLFSRRRCRGRFPTCISAILALRRLEVTAAAAAAATLPRCHFLLRLYLGALVGLPFGNLLANICG